MYAYANDRGWSIKQHTFVWKASTPPWFADMIKAAQWDSVRESTYDFMRQYFARYPLTAFADIANETAKNVPVLGQSMYLKAVDTGQIHWWQAFQPGLYTNGQHLVWNAAMETTYRQWDWLVPIYRKARELTRELAPNCKLILNDHTLLRDAFRRDLFISQVNKLKAEGLIDYMGEQGHHIGDLSSVQIQTELDILAKETGIPLVISEFDIRDNEVEVNGKVIAPGSDSLQLVYMKNVFPPIWEHPNTVGVTLWGYMEGHHWRRTAYLVRKDGTYRPAMTWLMKYKNGTTRLLEAETNDEKSSTMQVLNGSITSISPNNYLKFRGVKMESFKVIVSKYSVAAGNDDSIDVRLNSVSGELLATIPIVNTRGKPSIATADLKNEGVEGE